MDPYEELRAKAKEVAEQLVASGKRANTYSSQDGTTVKSGWRFHSYIVKPEEKHWGSGWKESWGTMELILTTDGEFYVYREHHVERSDRPREDSASLEPAGSRILVNLGKGKPFAYALEQLERFPWTI